MTDPPEHGPTTDHLPLRGNRDMDGADRERVREDRDRVRADQDRVRALLDLHEGRGRVAVLDDAGIADVLRRARRIAVVGASPRPDRPSHGVMATLIAAGYDVVPVRPAVSEVLGRRCYPDLAAAVAGEGPVDIVDVFRTADACPAHAREAVAVGTGCLWLQLGIVSWEAAAIAAAAGIPVVMDRCTAIELRRIPR
jgi:predicted CoA-binding protein